MTTLPALDTAPLFPVLHQHLLDLLQSLTPADWHRPTVCRGWSIKDITAHLLDGQLRQISRYRDHYQAPDGPVITSYADLVQYLNKLNHDWVVATRRLSPALLVSMLAQTGPEVQALLTALDPDEPALFSVAWAGETTSPNWFHVAREYTEQWHHQQQIRLALGQTEPLLRPALYHPLLDTFMRALPHTYRHTDAPAGTGVAITVTGDGGGTWWLQRTETAWQLRADAPPGVATTVQIDGPMAWRLVTKGLSAGEQAQCVTIAGDRALGQPVLGMTAVMA